MKVYGHPIIDLASGLSSVRVHACKTQTSNLDEARHLDTLFKAEFCKAYFSKNGNWPNVSINPGCHPTLVHAIANQHWPRADKIQNPGGICVLWYPACKNLRLRFPHRCLHLKRQNKLSPIKSLDSNVRQVQFHAASSASPPKTGETPSKSGSKLSVVEPRSHTKGN